MKRKLKVLHIASFIGNVGDNANHLGFKKLREMYLDFQFEVTQLEIREMFWGSWSFKSKIFVDLANEYELIVIGGGNFFELWVEKSSTGTTVDIDTETLCLIETPILFYSLGFDLGQGYSEANRIKFKKFMDYLISYPEKYFLSFRNDGAISNLKKLYGNDYLTQITMIPDAGFFANSDIRVPVEKDQLPYVAINLAGDMLDNRLMSFEGGVNKFVEQFSELMDWIIEVYNYEIVFVPHIFRDVDIIFRIIDNMKDMNRRSRVKISSYLTGNNGFEVIHNVYSHADLILANRFHSNIIGLSSNVDTIGLVNYPQIKFLYDEINSKSCIDIRTIEGFVSLRKAIDDCIQNKGRLSKKQEAIQALVKKQAEKGYDKLNAFILSTVGGHHE